jgi:hypothetical protein
MGGNRISIIFIKQFKFISTLNVPFRDNIDN